MPDLTTLANVKEFLDIPTATTKHDTLLGNLVTRLSAIVEGFLGRPLLGDGTDITELLHGRGTSTVMVNRFPIKTASLSSVKQALDQDFASATEQVTDASVDEASGIIYLRDGAIFWPGFRNVQVVYKQDDTLSPEVEQHVIEMVAETFKGRDMIHLQSMNLRDGGASNRILARFNADRLRDISHLIDGSRCI